MLTRFWRELGRLVGFDMRDESINFMQDGVTPYTERIATQWLADHFGDNAVNRGTVNHWLPHSPDLNVLDFTYWVTLQINCVVVNLKHFRS